MQPGSQVEVFSTWAGAAWPHRPSSDWVGGYMLESVANGDAIVVRTAGIFAGVRSRWALDRVRVRP